MDKAEHGKQALRVALFTGNYNYMKDGVSLTLNRLVGYLMRHGVEVLVLAPTRNPPAFAATGELVSVPALPIPFRTEYLLAIGLGRDATARLKAFKPDLFHIAVPDVAGLRALHLAKEWNVPVVASYHTRFDFYFRYYRLGFIEPLLRRYFRYFYQRCEHVYPPSESMADILRGEGIDGNLRIWSRGVDRTRFNPGKRDMQWRRGLGIADDTALICFAGRLVKEKNVTLLMRVFAALRRRGNNFRGIVFGDGPAAELMKSLNVDTIFTSVLHGDDLARAYASSDIFMFPSDSETFGNVTLEAMASGLAAICADASGSRTLVSHGKTGYLLDSTNEASFIEHAEKLIRSPELRHDMQAQALQRAKDFDWETINAGLLANYHQALHDVAARGFTRNSKAYWSQSAEARGITAE